MIVFESKPLKRGGRGDRGEIVRYLRALRVLRVEMPGPTFEKILTSLPVAPSEAGTAVQLLTVAPAHSHLLVMERTAIAAERLTADDYRALPETGPRYQLLAGELHTAPAPNLFHQKVSWNLAKLLSRYLDAHSVGQAFCAPCDVYLDAHNVVQPDLLFVANAHLGILAEDGVHGAPDLAIEILSPSTALLDTKTKRAIYARAGVKELWLVDPTLRQIHLYDFPRDSAKAVRVVEEDETFDSPLLPGLILSAGDIFRRS